jgi:hypothetical protein
MGLNPFFASRAAGIFSGGETPGKKRFVGGVSPVTQPRLPTPRLPQVMSEPNEGMSFFDEMRQIRQNKGPALTAYQEALKRQPTREDHKPSILRRIAGSIMGAGAGMQEGASSGFQTAQRVVDAPYGRAVERYNNEIGGLAESANLERQEMEDQIQALTQARALGLKYDEYKLKMLESERDYEIAQRNAAAREQVNQLTAQRDNTRDERERARLDAQIQYWNGQLQIGSTNARTGRMNAETNRENIWDLTNVHRPQSRALQLFAIESANTRNAAGRRPTPTEQARAVENALGMMRSDPKWRGFIQDVGAGEYPTATDIKEDDGSPHYREFKMELKRRVEDAIRRGSPFGDLEGEEDDPFIIEPWEE